MRLTSTPRTTAYVLFLLGCVTWQPASRADVWVSCDPDSAGQALAEPASTPRVSVVQQVEDGFTVRVWVDGLLLSDLALDGHDFTSARFPLCPVAGERGAPALPVVRRLFATPVGARIDVSRQDRGSTAIDLAAWGFTAPVVPVQGPESIDRGSLTNDLPLAVLERFAPTLQFDEEAYRADAYLPESCVRIQEVGIARGQQLHLLEVRPVAYNAARGVLAVTPVIDVTVHYEGGQRPPEYLRPTAGLNRMVLNPAPEARRRGGRDAGNYLFIVAPAYVGCDPLNQLIAARQAQGFNVMTYAPPTGMNRTAIRAYVESLWGTANAPDYLLIIGDAAGDDAVVYFYTIPAWNGNGILFAVCDLYYACMDGPDDWFPDIAYSRLPINSVSMLQDVVDKILTVEGGEYVDPGYVDRALFIAGTDTYSGGETLHEEMIANHMEPAGVQSTRVYATQGGDAQDISDAINQGTFLVSFFGHAGGAKSWWSPAYDFTHIEALLNDGLYPFLISFSCSSQTFHYTDAERSPGFLEKWLEEPNKGAAATYGDLRAMGPYDWPTWHNLYRFLMRSIYDDGIRELGPAVQAAAGYLVAYYGPDDPVSLDWTECFPMLGDPSMRLPERRAGNYLIITAQDYVGSAPLDTFTNARKTRYEVTTYVATPGTANTTIRNYVRSLWGTPDAPDFILIVGDTSGYTATATTVPHFQGGGSKQAATDWPYGCMDDGDDWYPEIPVGRFSVQNVSQLSTIVDKTLFVEAGVFSDPDYIRRGAFLANPDTQGTAEPTHDWVIANCLEPAGYEGNKLYAIYGAGTAQVAAAVNAGTMFTVYFGHSSQSGWWNPAFYQSNVNALINNGLYGLACGWSCNTARYTDSECFGETWVRAANKGAAVYISASNYIYWGSAEAWQPSVVLEKAFFRSMFHDGNWQVGPAWMAGLYTFLAEHGGWDGDPNHPPTQNQDVCRNFFEEFVILGDPALSLPRPSAFGIGITPTHVDTCMPDNAAFSVHVEQVGGFDQPVTLTVGGAPPGTTVAFSANNQVPPFNSVLVVGNTGGSTPGFYELAITGTSGSQQVTKPATLTLSSALPGTFTLLQPPNGAVNVARMPTLSWSASSQAVTYTLQIATDAQFNNIVYTTTTAATEHTVTQMLESGRHYYWRVRATNGCGSSAYTAIFTFDTLTQMSYYTEQFTSGVDAFDLENYTLRLVPTGTGSFYAACLEPASVLPTDPSGGTTLSLTDDGSASVSPGQAVYLYGTSYSSFWVNANGNITFNDADGTWTETLDVHFSRPRVSGFFDDLNPESGGTISWKATGDRVAITYLNVPEYPSSNSNTFQIELFLNGEIHVTWLGIAASDAIVGLSMGNGIPSDFIEDDLSALLPCSSWTGACCTGEACTIVTELVCTTGGGVYLGNDATCEPNPCASYESACVIIGEVVQGTESGDCPRWIELVNTGTQDFAFFEGGIIVQTGSSSDLVIDVDLTGVVIPAGQAFVIVSNADGICTGSYYAVYQQQPDMYTNITFGYGNERLILTDKADASNLLDIYGEFGVNGTGQPWEFTDGYSYRMPAFNMGVGQAFQADEWYLGGVGSLAGENPTQLLLTLTTPGVHAYNLPCTGELPGDSDCDGNVDFDDIDFFVAALSGEAAWSDAHIAHSGNPPSCSYLNVNDCDLDGDVDFDDIDAFVELLGR